MDITHQNLMDAYELLRNTPPFRGWVMPLTSEIKFKVVKGYKYNRGPRELRMHADCDGHTIRVANSRHGNITSLLPTMAHEMIHIYQMWYGLARGGIHNADFDRRVARVCKAHGWDVKTF